MTIRGQAALQYTLDSGQEVTHLLNSPLRNLTPRTFQRRYRTWAADGSDVEVVTVGSAREELEATVRYDTLPQDLLHLLRHGADGLAVTYYPDLTGHATYSGTLLADGNTTGLSPDSDRWFAGEYEATLILRRTDGDRFAGLLAGVEGDGPAIRYVAGGSLEDWTFTRSGTATRAQKDGTLTSTASGVPRIHWVDTDDDGVLDTPVWRLELSRENLCLRSEALDDAAWSTGTDLSKTADQLDAPDGESTADELTISGATNDANIRQGSITVTASTDYVFSFYAKLGTATGLRLAVYDESNSAFIDVDVSYSPDTSSWTRVEHSFTTPSGCTSLRVYPVRGPTGTGTCYIWGAQVEEGSFATSYEPTSGTTSTRAAETAYLDLPPALQTPGAATFYVKWRVPFGSGVTDNMKVVGFGADDPSDPRLLLFWLNGGLRVYLSNASTSQADSVTPSHSAGDTMEAAVTVTSGGVASLIASKNGGTAQSVTLSAVTLASAWDATRVYLNSDGGGNSRGAGDFHAFVALPRALTGTDEAILSELRGMVP